MKRCPSCQRTYPDDSPGFCVNDGTQLITEESQGYDPQKTILASAPPPPPAQYQTPPPPAQYPAPPPPASQPQPPQAWPPPPPPQQQQNWGGGYYPQPGQPYGGQYAPQGGMSNTLSLTTLILGAVSGLLGFLVFADYMGWIDTISSRSSAQTMMLAAFVPGVAALVVGVMALISKRQRSKGMAIVGMVLSAAVIGFLIYLEVEYGIFF